MQIVHVKPVSGRRVLDPVSLRPIPADGMAVELTSYWRRRHLDGDVELSKNPPPDQAAAGKAEKPKKGK